MIKKNKHRFVVLIEKEDFETFKKMAEEQNRSASNLGTIAIKEYIKNHS